MRSRAITGESDVATPDVDHAVREFHRQGFVVLPSAMLRSHAEWLAALIEKRYVDLKTYHGADDDLIRGDVSLMRMFEHHDAWRDVLLLEPVLAMVERILGEDCHVVAQNALRTPKGRAIVNWHIDDALFFPFLAQLPVAAGLDQVPCFSLNVMIVLSDVEEDGHGPTQVVAGSHLTGRKPEYSPSLPQGARPTSLLARAGDVYLVNSQTWHRGAQNHSDRTRYLLTTTFGRRFISQRFYPFLNYQMPPRVIAGASDRLLMLLGRHEKGPYG